MSRSRGVMAWHREHHRRGRPTRFWQSVRMGVSEGPVALARGVSTSTTTFGFGGRSNTAHNATAKTRSAERPARTGAPLILFCQSRQSDGIGATRTRARMPPRSGRAIPVWTRLTSSRARRHCAAARLKTPRDPFGRSRRPCLAGARVGYGIARRLAARHKVATIRRQASRRRVRWPRSAIRLISPRFRPGSAKPGLALWRSPRRTASRLCPARRISSPSIAAGTPPSPRRWWRSWPRAACSCGCLSPPRKTAVSAFRRGSPPISTRSRPLCRTPCAPLPIARDYRRSDG